MSNGVEGVVYLRPNTPDDVLTYLVDLPNEFVTCGSRISALERYKKVPTIVKAWQADCDKHGRKARAADEDADGSDGNEADDDGGDDKKVSFSNYTKDAGPDCIRWYLSRWWDCFHRTPRAAPVPYVVKRGL